MTTTERSKVPFADKNKYYNRVILATLSEQPEKTATTEDITFIWSFLQEPHYIIGWLSEREDAVNWMANYPDRIESDASLYEVVNAMVKNRQVEGYYAKINPSVILVRFREGFVFKKDTAEMKNVFIDVRYAMEAYDALKAARARSSDR